MRKEMPNKKSPSSDAIEHSVSAVSISKINNLLKPSSSAAATPTIATQRSNSSSQFATGSIGKNASLGKEKKTSANFDRYNLTADKPDRKPSAKGRKKHQSSGSDVDYDNENISPLYSNWDQETHEHLLPLQHYIIEQAKLSGSYHVGGDALDSDSLHSDSQSEHSFSGHEPDNEDSDHSDGDYLTHHYSSAMDEYGEVYYNVHTGFDRNPKQDNMFVILFLLLVHNGKKENNVYCQFREQVGRSGKQIGTRMWTNLQSDPEPSIFPAERSDSNGDCNQAFATASIANRHRHIQIYSIVTEAATAPAAAAAATIPSATKVAAIFTNATEECTKFRENVRVASTIGWRHFSIANHERVQH